MTYRRDPQTFAGAMTAALAAGQDWLAEQLGVSTSRLRQLTNPHTNHLDVLKLASRIDVVCAHRGLGTPIFNEYRRCLVDSGALPLSAPERRAKRLADAVRAAAALLLDALRGDEPRLQGAAA